jgi:Cdc6-like AAA superfamily ATPase
MGKSFDKTFCLTKGRHNFSITPSGDPDLYFGRSELQNRLLTRIKKDIVRHKPVKFVLIGDYGAGKTHTLRHLEYIMEKKKMGVRTVYADTGVIYKKSKFDVLYRIIMKQIGHNEVLRLLSVLKKKYVVNELMTKLDELSNDPNISNMLLQLLLQEDNPDIWKWFLGGSLSAGAMQPLKVTANLVDLEDFLEVLTTLGRLYREVENQQLLIMIDEAEELEQVDDKDAAANWENALRKLFDDSNDQVGVAFAFSARVMGDDQTPSMFSDVAVRSRISSDRRINLEPFGEQDLETFIKDLISGITNEKCVKTKLGAHDEVTPETYPFTKDAWDIYIDLISADAVLSKPRVAIKTLDEAAAEAYLSGKEVIDQETITSLPPPEE